MQQQAFSDEDNGFLLAIDFGGTKIAMATVTATGQRLHETEIPTWAEQGADRVLARMFDAALTLASKTALDTDGALLAVAAVTPGIVQPDGIHLAPNNPGWERLALAARLREGFGVDCVSVATDVKAAALAEARCGALMGVEYGLYLNVGTGLAAAPVVGGKVLRGAHGAAGEIGYQLRGVMGEVPFVDGGAPLENFISGRALADRTSALLGRTVTTREAFELAASMPAVATLIDDALDGLAMHVANMALLLDPSHIVIGGGMARVPAVLAAIEAQLERAVPYPPVVAVAAFGKGAALQGAIAAVMDAWAGHRVQHACQ
ncbi:ROK family protein [Paraburkholderia sp. DHOC27]|uniref:ROK family protein n=1 Tax=Paraburkholderia sp. DHOC27 TaxID=2303330 RepID=UPI0015F30B01|nr:ROK family protein [Paraburkholderia sp. DHOC27]